MTKLISAPNLNKQPIDAMECKLFVGSQAWDFAQMPMAERSQSEIALDGVLPSFTNGGGSYPPIILSNKELSNLTAYKLAPNTVRYVEIHRANQAENLTGTHITLICDYLAKHTPADTVMMFDEAGNTLENLSNYIQRLREDSNTNEIAEIITETAQKEAKANETDKRSPYIEKRIVNGIRGLYRIVPKYDNVSGDLLSETEQWLCDVVKVIGIGRSESDDFLVLEWQPEGSQTKIIEALPLEEVGEREGWKQLKKRGLKVTTKSSLRNELADYLQNTGDRTLWTITNATGWQKGAYILPNGEIIGTPESPVLFRSQSATFDGYGTKGTAESWKAEIADYAKGNPSMMLGLSVAFASPLVHLIEAESFGVHLFGGSTAGKTTIANLASSLFGHPDKIRLSWNTTALGIANEASARNDGLLPIDEIGQIANPKHAEQIAYTLFNGTGKIQGAKDGGNRELLRWRIVAFSTGEIDLESYLKSKGIHIHAGQLVRLLNVPISPAKRFNGLADGKAHADHLNSASRANYGVIGRKWIEYLIENRPLVTDTYHQVKTKWLNRLPNDASPQVQRVAVRFAILETALQLASHLTGWKDTDNSEAMLHCFNEWVNIFGMHSREEKQIIEQVNGWLLRNGSRFIEYPFNPQQNEPKDTAGYKELGDQNKGTSERFWVFPQVYIDDVISGFNEKQANEILSKSGMLEESKEKNYKYRKRLPRAIRGNKTIRCYVLAVLDEEEEENNLEE